MRMLGARLDAAREERGKRRAHRRALRFYGQFVRRGDLCFDIGANIGARAELLRELGARVVAVEPQPACAEAIRDRLRDVEVVEAAVGPEAGEAELLIASYHTLASISPTWVDAVRASGRFSEFNWDERLRVRMTTLDMLIAEKGEPAFCKIDVEGFELGVVQGLSRPLRALSFEFEAEGRADRIRTVQHLAGLGMTRFNFSFGESLEFALPSWSNADEMVAFLQSPVHSVDTFGDVYAMRPQT